MSSAIIKFEDDPNKMIYWKDHAYPAGLGFKLVDYYEDKDNSLFEDKTKYEIVTEIPNDIQYEYIIRTDHTVHCQECWMSKDNGYNKGMFRHGGTYDLKELQEKIRLQNLYSYRNEEAFNGPLKDNVMKTDKNVVDNGDLTVTFYSDSKDNYCTCEQLLIDDMEEQYGIDLNKCIPKILNNFEKIPGEVGKRIISMNFDINDTTAKARFYFTVS